MKEITLSSKFTKVGLYLSVLIILVMLPVIFNLFSQSNEFHIGMLIAGVILLAMVGFLIYQFKFVSHAKIENNKLVFTKQFSAPEVYSFDQIDEVSSFRLKNTKYTTVKMKNRHNTIDKYMIINSKSLLFKDKVDAESELKRLKHSATM